MSGEKESPCMNGISWPPPLIKPPLFHQFAVTYFFSTHPETVVHVWDVLFGSQGPAALQTLPQLLDLNGGQAEVIRVGLKVDLRLAIFGPSG